MADRANILTAFMEGLLPGKVFFTRAFALACPAVVSGLHGP